MKNLNNLDLKNALELIQFYKGVMEFIKASNYPSMGKNPYNPSILVGSYNRIANNKGYPELDNEHEIKFKEVCKLVLIN